MRCQMISYQHYTQDLVVQHKSVYNPMGKVFRMVEAWGVVPCIRPQLKLWYYTILKVYYFDKNFGHFYELNFVFTCQTSQYETHFNAIMYRWKWANISV